MDTKSVPQRVADVITQGADGETVLLHIESGNYFALNEVGSRVWSLCDGARSISDIVAIICDEFDVTEQTAESDALDLLAMLTSENLVVSDKP
jgi:Coenzyme PQQ synthesis protein D (PqqD)